MREILDPHREAVARLLHENKARNLRVFGSVARREATRASDIDLLVDFDPDASVLDQIQLKAGLESLLGRQVDVVDSQGLHWLIRPQVLFEAVQA